MSEIKEKFEQLAKDLSGVFAERREVVNGMVCAALAGEHVLLLGPPGTAKSALANSFCGGVEGSRFFSWLFTRFTSPEEIYGPISLTSLKQDKYKRVTTGKLPEAEVAFLDEIFKANSAILNTLLTAINERKFHNNGGAVDIPLRMVVGASNELPEGPELAALYDRFLVRYWVDYLTRPNSFTGMLTASEPSITSKLTLQDWDTARAEVEAVEFSKAAAQSAFKLRKELQREGVVASDRRWKRLVRLAKANAYMSGDDDVTEDHFTVWTDALWSDPAQRDVVAQKVADAVAASSGEAKRIVGAIEDLIKGLPKLGEQDIISADKATQKKLVTVNREGQRAIQLLDQLMAKADTPKRKEKIEKAKEDLDSKLGPVRDATRVLLGL